MVRIWRDQNGCWECNMVQLLWKTVPLAASQVAKPRVAMEPSTSTP